MKKTGVCPKCAGTDILRIPGNIGLYGVGNNIQCGLFSRYVLVDRYVCCKCGFSEEWIDEKDIERLEQKYRK